MTEKHGRRLLDKVSKSLMRFCSPSLNISVDTNKAYFFCNIIMPSVAYKKGRRISCLFYIKVGNICPTILFTNMDVSSED